MYQWSDEHLMIRDALRRFVDEEIRPHREELEYGDLPPYDLLRKLFATFGMDAMQRDSFRKRLEREKSGERSSGGSGARRRRSAASTTATSRSARSRRA